jgi:CBS domain-containing protein
MATVNEFEGDHEPGELEPIPHQGGGLGIETITRQVSTIMRATVATIGPDATVGECIRIMAREHFGCVLVVEGPRLIGILSERDVLTRVVDRAKDPTTERVRDNMTMEPESALLDDEIAYALNIMSVGGFRHVPVVDHQGALRGIVSIRDIANLLVDHFRAEILTLPPRTRHGPASQHGG